ncbi:hypothetical protein GYH30_009494, partial [Glycine max]|uniref:peroxidase n=1 Tax=Glycine max TaxID=3847 RepID=K7KJ86_SOYBN
AEDIITEQVKLLYKRHKNTTFSWLRNIFHDCVVQSCDASLLLDSTRRSLSEKETNKNFESRNFRYIETIKEALERECPRVVSCADILVLSTRDGIKDQSIFSVGISPHILLKTGRKDGRKSKTNVVELFRPNHNKSIFVVLDKFGAIGIDTPSIVALLGTIHSPLTHPCTYIYEMTIRIKHT